MRRAISPPPPYHAEIARVCGTLMGIAATLQQLRDTWATRQDAAAARLVTAELTHLLALTEATEAAIDDYNWERDDAECP